MTKESTTVGMLKFANAEGCLLRVKTWRDEVNEIPDVLATDIGESFVVDEQDTLRPAKEHLSLLIGRLGQVINTWPILAHAALNVQIAIDSLGDDMDASTPVGKLAADSCRLNLCSMVLTLKRIHQEHRTDTQEQGKN